MKRVVYDNSDAYDMTYIESMCIINPKLCKKVGLKVAVVEGGEGPIPHIHVFYDTPADADCAYIRLDIGEYSDHHSRPSRRLTRKEKQLFLKIMNSPWEKRYVELPNGELVHATGYQAAVDTWVDCYENDYSKFRLDTNGKPIMPDYSNL